MTRADRTASRAERSFSATRRPAAASLLLALALMAGACGGATQEAPDATTGTPGATGEPDVTEQTLSIVDVGSRTESKFTAPLGASAFEFTLDGSMVTYSGLDENGNAQVFVMDADGSNARQLTQGDGGVGYDAYDGPSWSSDGSMIAYARNTSDNSQIFVVGVSDGVSTMVTREPNGAIGPGGWTPDGGSIVFSTLDLSIPHYSALSLNLATGQTELIVADGSTPELSPDGAWIAFNSWLKPDPLVRLMLANSDGSERRVIARLLDTDGYQRWSPDSTQIAYNGFSTDDGPGTFVYDLATATTRFVTTGTIESWVDDDHILVS